MDSSISGFTQVIPRLGIPATGLADGPAGAVVVTRPDSKKNYYATGFPIGSLLACSWNTGLVETIGQAIGNENFGIWRRCCVGTGDEHTPFTALWS